MISDLTRHQIYIQRFGNGIYKEVSPLLAAIRDKLTGRILNATPAQLRKLDILLAEIEQGLVPVSEKLFAGLYAFAQYENTWTLKLLDSATKPAVTIGAAFEIERIKALVDNSKIQFADSADGMTVAELFTTFSDRFTKDVKQEIEIGLASGETSDQIARRIKALTDNRTAEQAKAVVITAANHAGSVTRAETFAEYGKLFKGEEYHAVLDSRTTIICASNDGKLFPMGQGPKPPLHYRCRSVRVPILKDQYALGGDTTRSSSGGPVSSKLTYSDWLKGQSAQVQAEVLGKERAKLFREGKITLDRFIDNTGAVYTLNELKIVDSGTPRINYSNISTVPAFNEHFKEVSNAQAARIIEKMPKLGDGKYKIITGAQSSFYDGWNREMHIATGQAESAQTAVHEWAHFLDYSISVEGSDNKLFPSGAIYSAIQADKTALGLSTRTNAGRNQIIDILKDLKENVSEEASDILDAFTDGYIFDKRLGYGHGSKYYKGLVQVPSEVFANIFQINAMGGNMDGLAKHFPETVAKFYEMLDTIEEALK